MLNLVKLPELASGLMGGIASGGFGNLATTGRGTGAAMGATTAGVRGVGLVLTKDIKSQKIILEIE